MMAGLITADAMQDGKQDRLGGRKFVGESLLEPSGRVARPLWELLSPDTIRAEAGGILGEWTGLRDYWLSVKSVSVSFGH